jgi:hypothetical protein
VLGVVVDSSGAAARAFVLSLVAGSARANMANDNFANAEVISGGYVSA